MEISDRLGRLATFYHDEALKDAKAGAYFSACVAQVSALEAALMAMCFLYPRDVRRTTVYQRKKARKAFRKQRYRALDFTLAELIRVADELGWLPSKRIRWGGMVGSLADFTHEVRHIRNLVHPAVWVRTTRNLNYFKEPIFNMVYEVFEVAVDWLVGRVHDSLRKHIDAEERPDDQAAAND